MSSNDDDAMEGIRDPLTSHGDEQRSQATERTLRTASMTLEHMRGGLSEESCKAVCELLLPETKAMAVAMTDRTNVLGYAGEMSSEFPIGGAIRTEATRDVLRTGVMETFTSMTSEKASQLEGLPSDERSKRLRTVPAGIVVPLTIRKDELPIGTIKFYYHRRRDIDRTQLAIARGLGELLSTQLNSYELDRQAELTAKAELRALQAQINPHFLFNTLNTIAALTRTDPNEARVLLREFATFYRQTLESSESLIPLSRELEQTRRYLRFEHARFGESRIIEQEHVEPGCEDVLVPGFIVQPIVENAVRHAMRDEGALRIDIHALEEDGAVLISVADDGLGMSEETANNLVGGATPSAGGTGIALNNVSERLKRFYGAGSGVEIMSRPGEGTCVTLRLANAATGKK